MFSQYQRECSNPLQAACVGNQTVKIMEIAGEINKKYPDKLYAEIRGAIMVGGLRRWSTEVMATLNTILAATPKPTSDTSDLRDPSAFSVSIPLANASKVSAPGASDSKASDPGDSYPEESDPEDSYSEESDSEDSGSEIHPLIQQRIDHGTHTP